MERAPTSLAGQLRRLARIDSDLARALAEVGSPPPRARPPGFAALIGIILAQQLSTASAAAIWNRLVDEVRPLSPERLLATPEERLRAIGFSRAKVVYSHALARAMTEGALDFDALHALDDAGAIAALTALPGLGRWSAEVYLLFGLSRPDIWPAGDLAIQLAVQKLKSLPERPSIKALDAMAEAWRPWRSAAARLLWHYYKGGGLPIALAEPIADPRSPTSPAKGKPDVRTVRSERPARKPRKTPPAGGAAPRLRRRRQRSDRS